MNASREKLEQPSGFVDAKLRGMLWTAVWYALAAGIALVFFLWIRSFGSELAAPAPAPGQELFHRAIATSQLNTLAHVLLALAVILVAARAVGLLFRRLGQPPVVGEVIAGIMLGPSLLGRLWPEGAAYVLPPAVTPSLGIIAQVGAILFMFLVGVELNPAHLRRSPNAVLAISHSSIVLPFLLGSLLSLFLYPLFSTNDVPFGVFILFMGISMSVTAFPVLARILADRGMQRTRLGNIALTCAAVDDMTAWCLLALVLSVASVNMSSTVQMLAASAIFVACMMLIVRPLMDALAKREEDRNHAGQGTMAIVLVALLLSAFAAEHIGIHALFGAFILGAVIPHDSTLARNLQARLHDVAVVFFLPVYFTFTGLRTEIGLVSGWEHWLICGLIVVTACAGKFGGGLLAARMAGLRWRESAALGILMNTRGLMELVVLNIGLDLKVLSATLFAMLVLMAVVTTVATTPILDLLNRGGSLFTPAELAESAESAKRANVQPE